MSRPGWDLYRSILGPNGQQIAPDFLRFLQGIRDAAVTGTVGAPGEAGATGATGPGVAAGGASGQVLAKTSATDYATGWITLATATLHTNRGNTAASSTTNTITLADATPAGKEASLMVVIGGFVQDPQYLTCNGTTTCTLSFNMPAHTDWFVIHAHPY